MRRFDCACNYTAHVLGVPLRISGLAFQQQDLGVSACATTALWSALQSARELEGSSAATPAQITIRASQFALPFGRSMPSEGLSLDQMCQAVQAFGYAPSLFRAENFEVSRALLYSAVRSGISPVLILEDPKEDLAHAVAVAGMKVWRSHKRSLVTPLMDDRAGDLKALYIHDDRYGPYLRAEIRKQKSSFLIRIPLRASLDAETWRLSHILIPMHAKIRLSFGVLRKAAIQIVGDIQAFRESVLSTEAAITSWDMWIMKSHSYVESLIVGENKLP